MSLLLRFLLFAVFLAVALTAPPASASDLEIRDERLVAEFERIRLRYRQVLNLQLIRDGRELFATELLSRERAFLAASKLPDDCVLEAWQPWHETPPFSHIACAKGDTTWVRIDLFVKLKVRQKAFVLLNARLPHFSNALSREELHELFLCLDIVFGKIHGFAPSPSDQILLDKFAGLLERYLQPVR